MSGASGTFLIQRVRWDSWTPARATGRGEVSLTGNCATCYSTARLALTRPKARCGRYFYGRLTINYLRPSKESFSTATLLGVACSAW